jgi:hypothetical protein
MDHLLAFGILSSFPNLTAFSLLKDMVTKAGVNYKKIIVTNYFSSLLFQLIDYLAPVFI